MTSAIGPVLRVLVALAAVIAATLGAGMAVLVDASGGAFAAGLLVALFATVIASVAVRVPLGLGPVAHARARSAIARVVPISSQSDPDARGHSRPRAPGVLLPAI